MLTKREEILNKKILMFKSRNINVDEQDLTKFLDNVYFKHCEMTDDNLEKFLIEDNIEDIISYLMSDAIINPKF